LCEPVLKVTPYTPAPILASVVRGSVVAQHDLLNDAYMKLLRIRRRMRKREILLEVELVKMLLWQVLKLQQELILELEKVGRR